jgi:hypothetical protein
VFGSIVLPPGLYHAKASKIFSNVACPTLFAYPVDGEFLLKKIGLDK